MHSKLKNTLSGLAAVAVFILGSTLAGEPIDGEPRRDRTATAPAQESPDADALRQAARTRVKLDLTLPYAAMPRLLPRQGS